MKKILLSFIRWWHHWRVKYRAWRHHPRLEKAAWQRSATYKKYLDIQLKRTLSKKNAILPERARSLIDQTASMVRLSDCDVLCIGCRNRQEIDYFQHKGAKSVTGIDLYSEDEAILVMDMHQMTFMDDSFDLIYTSHSLEHAYDVQKVIGEIVRVGREGTTAVIEMPVNYQTRGADLVDFGNLAGLYQAFGPHRGQIIWNQEADPPSKNNIKAIFTLIKGNNA